MQKKTYTCDLAIFALHGTFLWGSNQSCARRSQHCVDIYRQILRKSRIALGLLQIMFLTGDVIFYMNLPVIKVKCDTFSLNNYNRYPIYRAKMRLIFCFPLRWP